MVPLQLTPLGQGHLCQTCYARRSPPPSAMCFQYFRLSVPRYAGRGGNTLPQHFSIGGARVDGSRQGPPFPYGSFFFWGDVDSLIQCINHRHETRGAFRPATVQLKHSVIHRSHQSHASGNKRPRMTNNGPSFQSNQSFCAQLYGAGGGKGNQPSYRGRGQQCISSYLKKEHQQLA